MRDGHRRAGEKLPGDCMHEGRRCNSQSIKKTSLDVAHMWGACKAPARSEIDTPPPHSFASCTVDWTRKLWKCLGQPFSKLAAAACWLRGFPRRLKANKSSIMQQAKGRCVQTGPACPYVQAHSRCPDAAQKSCFCMQQCCRHQTLWHE